MKIPNRKFQLLAVSAMVGAGLAGPAQAALDLSGAGHVTYGDANSYALQVNGVAAGSTGPGSLYYVNSTPGAIKDLIVVATGASGGPVNTNVAGMDNALPTPSGVSGSNFFSGIWNSTLAAFTSFLGTENPLFFFNNNQVKSGGAINEDVAVWAQVSVTGSNQHTRYFTFSNLSDDYALFTEGGGGVASGIAGIGVIGPVNATAASLPGPQAGSNSNTSPGVGTDYVLSGGAICISTVGGVPVSCSSVVPHGAPINNNLGANQAAYAIDVPALDAFLAFYRGGGFAGYTAIHVDLRFGCDPATIGTSGGTAGVGDCVGRDANNGFEQLFIGTTASVTQVPEPGILGLLALGMLGLAATTRRRKV